MRQDIVVIVMLLCMSSCHSDVRFPFLDGVMIASTLMVDTGYWILDTGYWILDSIVNWIELIYRG